ncbi:MAG: hypothetical protein Kow0080_01570 [Candidatus Promineifilaceae bacterium]
MDLTHQSIPESVRNYSIGTLHLPKRTYNALTRAKIFSVGQLVNAERKNFAKAPKLGHTAISNIEATITTLLNCVNEKGEVNWFKFWEVRGIEVIPPDFQITSSVQEIIIALPKIIECIIKAEFGERDWIIAERRLGLGGASILTLEELGIAFGLTRERVRQIEARVLDNLTNVLLENSYPNKQYHVHPVIISALQEFSDFVNSITDELILENELLSEIEQRFGVDPDSVKSTLYFLFALNGLTHVRFNKSDLEPAWGKLSLAKIRRLERIVGRIDKLLTEKFVSPVSEVDILIEVNKNLKSKNRISLDDLRHYIKLCSSVETHSDGFYWGKFEHLVGRGNQVERVLVEKGEPVHISQITREINHRLSLHGKRTVNERNLRNQISGDERFTPIGKSGEWGLSSWVLNTGTIVDLMKQCLVTRNSPATPDEIYSYVSERRPVQKSSINSYLVYREEFAKVDRIRWGLKIWDEVKDSAKWTPLEVGQFVEQLFKKHRTKKIQYRLIKQALIEATGLTDRQVQGLLNVNPVIKTEQEKGTNELYAFFQSDYKRQLERVGARFKRKKRTLRQKVDEFVRMTLENAPGQQIALADLVAQLVEKFNRIDKTFYHYISDLDYVEKFTIPETNVKMCRFKRDQKAFPFSQVEDIQTHELKKNVGRALTFLNESDVDIALFLLSKEFEATLKKYLETASARGEIYGLPSGRLSLVSMIDYIGRKGILTDKAVLQFLRQKRNDRAHGSMPTAEERSMMMKYAQTTAGMYIDYIKFFDDLTKALLI